MNHNDPLVRRLALGLLSLLLLASISRAQGKPNILFIAIDDLNDWVGCQGGHPDTITPNIDALAKRGVLFTNAHCQAPICGPSRASIFTGLRPSTTGIYGQIKDKVLKKLADAQGITLIPDYFEEHGYVTMAAGKLYHNGDRAKTFGEYGPPKDMGPKPKQRFKYNAAWFPDRSGSTQTDWAAYPESDEMMPDHKIASYGVAKLGEKHEQPFFLAVGFCRPHVPWYAPKKWFDRHPIGGITTPPYKPDDWDDLPDISKRVNFAPMMPAMDWVLREKEWPNIVQAYLACVTFVDHQVGRVVRALEASPHANNTIIVLWSDHGYHLGEKGRFAKQSMWERSSKVNLIIVAPNTAHGRKCAGAVQLLDLYPTLLELCELPRNKRNEGHSLVKLLKNPVAPWPHVAITTYGPNNHSLRDSRYRYIRYEDGSEELYDHRRDPNEWHNIASDPDHAEVIQALQAHLPRVNAKNAKGSAYSFNDYFKQALK
jgi:arylsulfatase A-like enzyme